MVLLLHAPWQPQKQVVILTKWCSYMMLTTFFCGLVSSFLCDVSVTPSIIISLFYWEHSVWCARTTLDQSKASNFLFLPKDWQKSSSLNSSFIGDQHLTFQLYWSLIMILQVHSTWNLMEKRELLLATTSILCLKERNFSNKSYNDPHIINLSHFFQRKWQTHGNIN